MKVEVREKARLVPGTSTFPSSPEDPWTYRALLDRNQQKRAFIHV